MNMLGCTAKLLRLKVPCRFLGTCDIKRPVSKYVAELPLGSRPEHHYHDVHELLKLDSCYCMIHQRRCLPPTESVDLLVAGFPCQPYSRQNNKRQLPEADESYYLCPVSLSMKEALQKWRPRCYLFENVEGFLDRGASQVSGFDILFNALTNEQEYTCETIALNLRDWVDAERTRVFVFGFLRHHLRLLDSDLELSDRCETHQKIISVFKLNI